MIKAFTFGKFHPFHKGHEAMIRFAIKPFFVKKAVILGTESTGKTTLTRKLAKQFDCSFVPEAGMDVIQNSKHFTYNDLIHSASEHALRIRKAETANSPLVIIDTDVHITKSYSTFCLGRELLLNQNIYDANKANLYLYLTNDVEFVQDGTRLDKEDRDLLDFFHRKTLAAHNIPFVEISGNWDECFEKAKKEILSRLVF
jgi:HTH-type transcriptional repressor of NAD biosynthesis genes